MHELSIVRSLLEIIADEMKKRRLSRLSGVRVRIGELTAVDPGSLRFAFDACTKEGPLNGATLEIIEVPLTGRCQNCSREFRIKGFNARCPRCKNTGIERLTGEELDIVSMDAT